MKRYESSWARVFIIMGITYATLSSYMNYIGVNDPLRNAVIPTLGFYLSTWSLSYFKNIWIQWYDWNWGFHRPENLLLD